MFDNGQFSTANPFAIEYKVNSCSKFKRPWGVQMLKTKEEKRKAETQLYLDSGTQHPPPALVAGSVLYVGK
jgi:hypothetical protein